MKKEQMLILNDMIKQIFTEQSKNSSVNSKFLYSLKRNQPIIKEAIDQINQDLQISTEVFDKIQEYENKRMSCCIEYSKKDENGKPILENQNFIIFEDKKKEFENKIEELNAEYKEAFNLKMAEIQRRNAVLNEEIEIDFYKIKLDFLPEKDFVTPEMMEVLYILVDGD